MRARRRIGWLIGVLTALALAPMPAAGRPGDLDPTFGSGGVGYQNLASSQSRINDVVLLPDGRFIAAGFRWRGRNNDPALIRYQSNGTVDTSFGNGGVASVGFGNGSDYAEAVTRQSDGKLVVAGWSASLSPNRWALARFTADGIIDPTFGNGGTVMTLLQSGGCEAYAVVQQADGKLVAAGRASNGGSYYLALVRYNADGSLDTTFGSGGIVVQPLGTLGGTAYAIAQLPDGKLVVAGTASGSATGVDVAVARFTADGVLDATFGTGGFVTTAVATGTRDDVADALQILPDGKLVVAGHMFSGTSNDVLLIRYGANGAVDTSFGTGGIVTRDFGTNEQAYALVRQSDGKLAIAGSKAPPASVVSAFFAARFLANGSIDSAFGSSGAVVTDISPTFTNRAHAAVLQPDGRLLAVGFANSGRYEQFAAIRYTTAGALDGGFGTAGIVTTAVGTTDDVSRALIRQSDGKLVAGGYTSFGSGSSFNVARYTPDGSADTSFGSNGITESFIGTQNGVNGLVQQSDGKVVAVVRTTVSTSVFGVTRFTTGGVLDTTFNGSGKTSVAIGSTAEGFAAVQQPDGKLVVAGEATVSGSRVFALVRLTTAGALDSTFGSGGIVTTTVGNLAGARAIIRQPDGKLLVAGRGNAFAGNLDSVLVRYHANGTLDTTFGTGGIARHDLGFPPDYIQAIALQPDGRIISAGTSGTNTDQDFTIVRYHPDGSLDTSFGGYGVILTWFGPGIDVATGVVLQADGKIVAAGYTSVGTSRRHAMARYNPDGSLDGSFGDAGMRITPLGIGVSEATSLLLLPDGKLATVGEINNGGEFDLAVARFVGQVCGDAQLQDGEECDDGNPVGGDGCDAACRVEPTATATASATPSETATTTPTAIATAVDTATPTAADTPSVTPSITATRTALDTATPTATETAPPTDTTTPTDTATPTATPTDTATPTATATAADSASPTPSPTPIATDTATATPSPTALPTDTPTAGACAATPRSGCRASGRGVLVLQAPSASRPGRLVWRWGRGPETAPADFGDPRTDTSFALCVYADDTTLTQAHLVPDASAWQQLATHGYRYRATSGVSVIRQALLRGGDAGRGTLLLRGAGPQVDSAAWPTIPTSVVVQWRNESSGTCWESRFDPVDVRIRSDKLKARF